MIPLWKLKRELKRLVGQVGNILRGIVEPVLRWNYDRTRWSKIHISGEAPSKTDKFCILLVYQPKQLAKSIINTCKFLSDKGYSVVIVANGGLQPAGRNTLKAHVWRIIERPNFGYDFGGYRDGIHFLMREGINPRFLILLNDSIWFPLNLSSPVIEQLEVSKYDLTGLFLHVPARYEYAKEAQRRLNCPNPPEWIESYVTLVPARTFSMPAFHKFWLDYPQSSSKRLTIKRGEIGFSKAMTAAGLTIGALSRRRMFIADIEARPNEFLERTLQYAAYSDPTFAANGKNVLAAPRDSDWRNKALEHIRTVVARRRFNASFPWATEKIFATNFVKKHPSPLFQLGRRSFLDAVDNGDLIVDNAEVIAEIRSRVMADESKLN